MQVAYAVPIQGIDREYVDCQIIYACDRLEQTAVNRQEVIECTNGKRCICIVDKVAQLLFWRV